MENNSDLVDLLLLSKSKLIIPTQGSTFSAWAVFLSAAPVVLPIKYSKALRPEFMYETIYEGEFDKDNEIMMNSIESIQ